MITHDQLIFILNQLYPQLTHGRDYLVGHPLDANTKEQSGDPYLLTWPESVPKPDVAALIASYPTHENAWLAIQARDQRDYLLRQSDWTQAADVPDAVKAQADAWRAYREALRNLPQQTGFPAAITWPDRPA
ncbi:tail fiber assembly protein [Paraburkholderia youngii]|uniref:tail fiber assembly protein n=1 Tax=Paraburkholderia youngii TaxID=2782701 RepID=UPI001591FFA6|nr:tail fiber assembly protein [Paraburkholderia youngii]NUX58651.1 hypothetical protein [Paraburkholderia youngii]